MKQAKQLIFTACLILIVFAIAPLVRAYEADQLADCILSARENPSLAGVSESSIQNYCECALELIVDQKKDVTESGRKCAVKSFTED
tara:strand:+ start:755 stop:1015 length:261 start_codon:yes stop_codon:yes gene_type:complete